MRLRRLHALNLALQLGEPLIELLLLLLVRTQDVVYVSLLVYRLLRRRPGGALTQHEASGLVAESLVLVGVHVAERGVNDEGVLVKQLVLRLPSNPEVNVFI